MSRFVVPEGCWMPRRGARSVAVYWRLGYEVECTSTQFRLGIFWYFWQPVNPGVLSWPPQPPE
eukprot:17711-Alexandrium_andersonii.AAC.1